MNPTIFRTITLLLCASIFALVSARAEETAGQAKQICAAADVGDVDKLKSLLGQGVDVNIQDDDGRAALHCAAGKGHRKIVEFLLANGANVNIRDKWQRSPLDRAAKWDRAEIVELLLAKGAEIESQNSKGETPLYTATITGRTKSMAVLVAHGANITAKTKRGDSPLDKAKEQRQELVDILQRPQKPNHVLEDAARKLADPQH